MLKLADLFSLQARPEQTLKKRDNMMAGDWLTLH